MSKYNLNALDHESFENLAQSLVLKVIGLGCKVYGLGSDGAREATFEGKAPYPSEKENWAGQWIFQAKYHNINQIGQKEARRMLYNELDDELHKITEIYKHPCDNYILITNVSLSPVFQKGLKDRIDNTLVPKFKPKIRNVHVWGAEEICRLLDLHLEIRTSYSHLIISGDIIASLLGVVEYQKNDIEEIVKLYCSACFIQENSAGLDDAGDTDDRKVALQNVFIDLDVLPPKFNEEQLKSGILPKWLIQTVHDEERISALSYILDDTIRRVVFVGGPGQGKSTLGQFISQVHRARLLGKLHELGEGLEYLENCIPRIPFRVILKDFANWINHSESNKSLFDYLSEDITKETGRAVLPGDVHKIIKENSILLVLDGLDEVPEKNVREKVLTIIKTFISQINTVYNCDLRILCSTRPQGYSEEFDPNHYLHLSLTKLSEKKAIQYAEKWIECREGNLVSKKSQRILEILSTCMEDEIVNDLTKTPLQVTILLVIIRAGSTPPKQREELYQKYMDTIYSREQNKSPSLVPSDKNLIYGLHKFIAYQLHKRVIESKTNALMNINEFRESVIDYLYYDNPYISDEEISRKIIQIINEAQDRLVLIESPQVGKIGFTLTVMREFFTACHLVDTSKDSVERIARFKSISRSTHWRNVVLFFAGRVGRTLPGEAPALIDICREIDTEEDDIFLKRGAQLVLEIIDDRALREPYQEISAIQYAILLLDYETSVTVDEIYQKIENVPDDFKKRAIKAFLINRLENVKPEKVYKYADLYEKLFGYDEILGTVISKISKDDIDFSLWGFLIAVKYKIDQEWVIELYKSLLDNVYIFELSLKMEEYWANLFHYFKHNNKNFELAILLFEVLSEKIDNDEDQLVFETLCNKIIEINPYESNASSLVWGICFIILNIYSELYLKYPVITNPSKRKIIEENSDYIVHFIRIFDNDRSNLFIRNTVMIFKYLLEPNKYELDLSIEKEKDEKKIYYNFRYLISNVTLPHNQIEILINLYTSEEEFMQDFDYLYTIVKRESNIPNHYEKLKLWKESDFSIEMEKYLDINIISELKSWFNNRNLSLNILKLIDYSRFKIDIDYFKFYLESHLLKIIETSEIKFNSMYSLINFNYSFLEDNDVIELIDEIKERLWLIIDNENNNVPALRLLLSILINTNKLLESDLRKLHNIYITNQDLIEMDLGYVFKDFNVLTKFFNSEDEKVVLIATFLISQVRLLTHRGHKFDYEISLKFWEYVVEGNLFSIHFERVLINATLNWGDCWEYVYHKIIKEHEDSKTIKMWLGIVAHAGYTDNSKMALCELIKLLIINKETFVKINNSKQYVELLAKFLKLAEVPFTGEDRLNLPLPKRNVKEIFW